ncbi:DUF6710 family protein [Vallitalea guaymasensis]|uniref:DUF6710 family protein n=1 Tax=Vallitalea guaymasensis TaxID=1185412 RepID=UPI000DE31E7A|nr:DUF6710 family protein [Vallitalea guaymasensis]
MKLFRKKNIKKKEFNNILEFAKEVIKQNNDNYSYDAKLNPEEHPIIDVIRALGLSIHSRYVNALIKGYSSSLPRIDMYNYLFDDTINNKGERFYDIKKDVEITSKVVMDLNKDLLLPWPWERKRFINNIASIGKGRFWGEWEQDDINHYVTLWLPIGIGWVNGGNHSISTGIIKGEGKLIPKYVYDIRPIYDYVVCDGEYFWRTEDETIIEKVKNTEMAAIFEIGRIMTENNLCYKSIL